ncbi:polyhydroxyalkanoate depolymerase [Ferrovibrio xuzhouensis]|uniref:Polyhydroxyalkanoate depolymerase n=1 Tax=Ferrovibrio xuzhouensis TaxID=1576914 RepID=A0ABV7VCK0_9PROT
MKYLAYQTQANMMAPLRQMAGMMLPMLGQAVSGSAETNFMLRGMAAATELLSRAGLSHSRLPFGIDRVKTGNREVAVTEEVTHVTPFGTLLHFKKDTDVAQPRVMVVAPLSGHFATLLRGTVETLLQDHDVYITDWHNARDVPLSAGRFGVEEYIEHLIDFLHVLGPDAHVVAVCQPCVQALAAVAVMAESGDKAQPRSMTLMAGPIDCRINPTGVNDLAVGHSMQWFEAQMIDTVPPGFAGMGRKVYPGFVQLSAFMSMNLDRHLRAHAELFAALVHGDTAKAEQTKTFYDEYFAVLDLAAEFYLETVQWVFQDYRLAKGELTYRGKKVDPSAIRRTALLTVEGERDDICAIGQTMAAHDLCSRIRPYMKRHHMQAGVGHYGVFSGRKWQNQIYPIVKNTILAME